MELPPDVRDGFQQLEAALQGGATLPEAVSECAYLAESLGDTPAAAAALVNLGYLLILQRRLNDALECCQRALQANLGQWATPAWIIQGDCLLELGRKEEALASYTKATVLGPDNLEAWEKLGHGLQKAGQDQDAIAALDRALALAPNSLKALRQKAICLTRQGRRAEARFFDARLESAEPSSFSDWMEKAWFWADRGRLEQAKSCCQEALALQPYQIEVLLILGHWQLESDELDPAMQSYDEALTRDAGSSLAWLGRAHCFWRRQLPVESMLACDRALALDKDCAGAAYWKGMLLYTMAQHQEALTWLEKAVAQDPDMALCWLTKAGAEFALGRKEASEESLRRCLALSPPDDARESAERMLEVIKHGDAQEAAAKAEESQAAAAAAEAAIAEDYTRVVRAVKTAMNRSLYFPLLMLHAPTWLLDVGTQRYLVEMDRVSYDMSFHPCEESDKPVLHAKLKKSDALTLLAAGELPMVQAAALVDEPRNHVLARLVAYCLRGVPLAEAGVDERESLVYAALLHFIEPTVAWQARDGAVKLLRYDNFLPGAITFATSGLSTPGFCEPAVDTTSDYPPQGAGYEVLFHCPKDAVALTEVLMRALDDLRNGGPHILPGGCLETDGRVSGVAGLIISEPGNMIAQFPVAAGVAKWSLLLCATAEDLKEAEASSYQDQANKLQEKYEDFVPVRKSLWKWLKRS